MKSAANSESKQTHSQPEKPSSVGASATRKNLSVEELRRIKREQLEVLKKIYPNLRTV